ncbi:MAG: reverse transcriptase/maturase family protein [Patescibacteria group bacterium]
MSKKRGTCHDIISVENLLKAWEEFLPGKKNREDVCEFSKNLMENILDLHNDLTNKSYKHGGYKAFNISDPKPRNIHKASVRDRLLHHALYRKLYPFFDKTFISESYSCRVDKGTHRAVNKFRSFAYKESKNHFKTLWVLKCDIRKFFASINQKMLLEILTEYIPDQNVSRLLSEVIFSFYSTKVGVGLPLGNLTSQLLVNIYMNPFDQWMKHIMKARYYIRYADDFMILNTDKDFLLELTPKIADFLEENLKLQLHPDKLFIKTFASGLDFLGWVHFPNHRVLRTSIKRRVLKALNESENTNSLISYSGLLKHENQFALKQNIDKKVANLLKKAEN